MFNNYLFNVPNKDTYPPFKNGLYLEEYFLKKYKENKIVLNRIYIPCLWTNFQIHPDFQKKKEQMQNELNEFINNNPSKNGYFTVIQYDDGSLLKLPKNTIIYGACSGNIPISLIYQDLSNTLENIQKKSFKEKVLLCSFVGRLTHKVRHIINSKYSNNTNFKFISENTWSPIVNENKQEDFIYNTINSKFALAPRGYGRSSFRFFEIFKLGTIPIYIWDDINWLPYQDILDYTKFSIVLNINEIDKLEEILLNINENKYNEMILEYKKNKYWFSLDGMYDYIINKEQINI
jgi:hypothetical protein